MNNNFTLENSETHDDLQGEQIQSNKKGYAQRVSFHGINNPV